MSLQWAPAAVGLTHQEATSLPSSFISGNVLAQGYGAQEKEVNISRILRAIERLPLPDIDQDARLGGFTQNPNEVRHNHRPPQGEEHFGRRSQPLYADQDEPPLRPQTIDYQPPDVSYRPRYQLARPNKNLKPVHVSISQQTVNGLLSLLLLSVISIYGCMGTIFIMSALTVVESLQTRGNCYLVSLAMAHLIVTLLVIPSSALQIMAGDTLNAQRVCHYQWLTLEFSLMVSQLSFMLIAADNYLGYKCSEKVVTRVASFVQGQQQAGQGGASIRDTNCERHLTTSADRPAEPGSCLSPVGGAQKQQQTAAQSMQADFLAQSAQVAARLEMSQRAEEEEQQQQQRRVSGRKQSTLIRRLLSNLPRRLLAWLTATSARGGNAPTTRTRQQAHTHQAQAQATGSNCLVRRESWHLKSSLADHGPRSNHCAPGEWQDSPGAHPAGKSRRLAHQFASETGSRLERPGGCMNYRNCCGRLTVLFWIACVWATALAHVLYQHELSFGARFCSTSGSNSYQWGPVSQSPNLHSIERGEQQLKFQQAQPGKIGASLPSASRLPPPPPPGYQQPEGDGQLPVGPSHRYSAGPHLSAPAASGDERREQRAGSSHQLVAPGGRRSAAADEANERWQDGPLLFATVGSALSAAGNQSALRPGEQRATQVTPKSNPPEWIEAAGATAASRVDRAEVARGHSSEVARGANRNEQNQVGANNWAAADDDDDDDDDWASHHHRGGPGADQRELVRDELLLRNRNDGTTASLIRNDDRAAATAGPRQVQVGAREPSRLHRDLDHDYASPLRAPAAMVSDEQQQQPRRPGRKARTKREPGGGEAAADFIILLRSMGPRNHFGVAGASSVTMAGRDQRQPRATSRGAREGNESAVHFDPRGAANSSGDERSAAAILRTARIERLKDAVHFSRTVNARRRRRPTDDSERLDTKPARAAAPAAVHLDDDERDEDDDDRGDGDDKTPARAVRTKLTDQRRRQQQQQQLPLIDGSQRANNNGHDDDDDRAPRWRRAFESQPDAVSELSEAAGEQPALVWPPASGSPESRRHAPRAQRPQRHPAPRRTNNERRRKFSRFPPHNDDDDDELLSSSSMSKIGPDGLGSGAQNNRDNQTESEIDVALASFAHTAGGERTAEIIMHAQAGRARISPARKLIAAVTGARTGQHTRPTSTADNKHEQLVVGRRSSRATLNDRPELDETAAGATGENNEIEGEKSWPAGVGELRSSGGQAARGRPCDSCHRNKQQGPARGRLSGQANSNGGKQIATTQSQARDRDKFSDGSNNSARAGKGQVSKVRDDVGQQRAAEQSYAPEGQGRRVCDNHACDKQTIDRDKHRPRSAAAASLSIPLGLAAGDLGRPAPVRRAQVWRRKEAHHHHHLLMNNNNSNNNKLGMHSNGAMPLSHRVEWTNAPAGGKQRMQISDAPPPPPRAVGANLRLPRAAQVAGGETQQQQQQQRQQINPNPIDYGAHPSPATAANTPAPRLPEQRQTTTGGATNHERRRDLFWPMLLGAVVAPSLLAALLFARAYIRMKEFKMRPYKPMPAAALNSTPPALLTPRSPIPLIAQRQVYTFDSPAQLLAGGNMSPKALGHGAPTAPSNVACVGSSAGFGPGGVAEYDSRSCASMARTEDDGEIGEEEEDAGESLARIAQETVRRVSEITSEGSFKRRPLARHHTHSTTTEAGQPAPTVRPPPPPPRLSQPIATATCGETRRQVNQVMSAPPPSAVVDPYLSSTLGQQQQWPSRPLPFNGPTQPLNYPHEQQQQLNGSAPPLAWPCGQTQDLANGASFNHRAPGGPAASCSAPPSAGFQRQQLVNYCSSFPIESQSQQQQQKTPTTTTVNGSQQAEPLNLPRYRRQRHSSPVAFAARALNSDSATAMGVSPIMESPAVILGGQSDQPDYGTQQQHQQYQFDRHHSHAQSFHYGTAAHHYQSYAARQAAAQEQQQQPPQREYRTAQQRASLQTRSGQQRRLPLIESSRSSGEAADSTASCQQDAAMSQALANVIRSVDDNGDNLTTSKYETPQLQQQQRLSPTAAVVPASAEPSAGSAASSLKRRLAPKPLELIARTGDTAAAAASAAAHKSSTTNTKVILCTYSYMTDDQLLKSNMIVFLIHSAFWLPFVALCISAQYRDSFTGELRDLVWWLAVLNCCSCSYLYALTNKDFREAFHKLFFYCFCQSHVTLQRKTPIFRRQLDVDGKGNLRVHIIPGLNVYSSKLFAASGGLRDGLGNDLSAFAASAASTCAQTDASTRPPAAATGLTPNGLAPLAPGGSNAQSH